VIVEASTRNRFQVECQRYERFKFNYQRYVRGDEEMRGSLWDKHRRKLEERNEAAIVNIDTDTVTDTH
jgi:hypothetical protein